MALPCVWMSAGLVRYKLCDRDLDCEHCPLDAALRGGRPAFAADDGEPISEPGRRAVQFPDDRRYTGGHTWVQERGRRAEEIRLGLDGFAAALTGPLHRVRVPTPNRPLDRGETVCELDLGVGLVPIATPLAGRGVRRNPALDDDPDLASRSPYEEGWLVELTTPEPNAAASLLAAAAARDAAGHDLRRFRRRVALHLLADPGDVGPTLADGGAPLTDLRRILGPDRYLDLLRELIH